MAGRHADVIEACSQALAIPALSLVRQIELLDLRVESLIAQGLFADAAPDADSMLALRSLRPQASIALAMSVCEKSLPLYSNGRPRTLANA